MFKNDFFEILRDHTKGKKGEVEKKFFYGCYYAEMGAKIEDDEVTSRRARAWFKDSYRHHTGRYPSESAIKKLMRGKTVVSLAGGLDRAWKCYCHITDMKIKEKHK